MGAMQLRAPTSDADRGCPPEVVRAFHAAVVEVDAPDGTWSLRPLGVGEPPAPEVFPFGLERLSVLTAYNPGGVARPEHVNVAAQAALTKQLQMAAVPAWPARSRSPEGDWEEPSLALPDVTTASAASLSLRHEQAAFFLWTPGFLTIVWTPPNRVVTADLRFVRASFRRRS